MTKAFVIAGTDTDVGKTVFSAALAGALDAAYWKPIQAGLDYGGDSDVVRRLSGLPEDRILPELYRLKDSLSPHRAAELQGTEIDVEALVKGLSGLGKSATTRKHGHGPRAVVIEAVGGLMVPLTRKHLQIDVLARWGFPVILCARTALGTINHTLLSLEALRKRSIPMLGLAFIGQPNEDNERTICELGSVGRLGRLPIIDPLESKTLAQAFAANFSIEAFA